MFTEQLIVKRKEDNSWGPPVSQTPPIDDAINAWIDKTGNDLVSITSPGMFMQWMDPEKITRLVIVSVMVTYIPATEIVLPLQEIK